MEGNNVSKEEVERFLLDMEDFEPLIPDEVASYYLGRSGFVCPDVRVQRAISLAAQHFISDIVETSLQYTQNQKSTTKKKKDKKKVLKMDVLSESLQEYGITVKKPPYFADNISSGTKTKVTGKRKRIDNR